VVRGQELVTLVVYDVEDDRIRSRIASACKDYGLERIQYSAFCGLLDSTRRGELFTRLSDTLGRRVGKVLVVPVCERDARARREVINEPTAQPLGHA
jgi:CRISPR-associated protein Cas2